jgi:hypothetical protein
MVVAKLKGARDRIRRTKGKCEGRKSCAEREGGHEMNDLARWLRSNTEGRPYSLRAVAAELAGYGYVTPSGRPYAFAIAPVLCFGSRIITMVTTSALRCPVSG